MAPPKGWRHTAEARAKIGAASRGRKTSPETRAKLSAAKLGNTNSLGHTVSDEVRAKLSALASSRTAENSPRWRGDDVGYSALHRWMNNKYPRTGTCEACGEVSNTEWSNVDHMYRRIRADWQELCKSCHDTFDINLRAAEAA